MPDTVGISLILGNHLVIADVDTRGLRILDYLNDPHSSDIRASTVTIISNRAHCPNIEVPTAVFAKSNITAAILHERGHEAPVKRMNSLVSKRWRPAVVVAGNLVVQGELALKKSDDMVAAFHSEMGSFFPIPAGTVSDFHSMIDGRQSQVVIINKKHVSLFYFDSKAMQITAKDLLREIST